MMSVYRKRCLCMSFLTIFRQPRPSGYPLTKIPAGAHGAPTFFLNRARLGVNPALGLSAKNTSRRHCLHALCHVTSSSWSSSTSEPCKTSRKSDNQWISVGLPVAWWSGSSRGPYTQGSDLQHHIYISTSEARTYLFVKRWNEIRSLCIYRVAQKNGANLLYSL